MNMSFLVIDFIIFVAAATGGFIWGAMWVDSEFEKDAEYLAAEVENLNDALAALNDSYNQELMNGDKMFIALQRATDELQKNNTELRKLIDENDNLKKALRAAKQ
jgi:uncharacterized protein (UPF0333 family)